MPSMNPNSPSGLPGGMDMGHPDDSSPGHSGMPLVDHSGRPDPGMDHRMIGYGGYPGYGGPPPQHYGGGPPQFGTGGYPPYAGGGGGGGMPPSYSMQGSGGGGGGGSQYAYARYPSGPPPGRGGPPPSANWYGGYNPGGPPDQPRGMIPVSGFPQQQGQPHNSRSSRGGRAGPPPRAVHNSKGNNAGTEAADLSKENKPGDNAAVVKSSAAVPTTSKMDDLEARRVRNAEEIERNLQNVKPIQTDFHFFVLEMRDTLRVDAENEVRQSMNKGDDESLDPFLVNTNLNTRLSKAWEDLSEEARDIYVQKEEQDRQRFMDEDEVASRHCVTLTARQRSETKKNEQGNDSQATDDKEVQGDTGDEKDDAADPELEITPVSGEEPLEESSPKKAKVEEETISVSNI